MLKQNKWLIPLILAALATAALILGYRLSLPRGDELPASLTIAPASGSGPSTPVPQTESFQLELDFSATEEQLREMLTVSPDFAYALEGEGKHWILTPETPLEKNTIVTFQVDGQSGTLSSYAFQTESDLLVSGVYPRNGADYLDVNTVVELTFNHAGVQLNSEHFSILPAVSGTFSSAGYKARFLPDEPLSPGTVYRVTLKTGLSAPSGAALREDYTFTFSTVPGNEEKQVELTPAGGLVLDALPGEDVFASFWANTDVSGIPLQMDVYRFPGINTFSTAVTGYARYYANRYGQIKPYAVSTEGLSRVFTQNDVVLTEDEQGRPGLYLPSNLSEGWYVLTLTGEHEGFPISVQQMVQISAVSVFTQSVQGDTLFWLNDPVSALPMSNAEIDVTLYREAGDAQATEYHLVSSRDGLARIDAGESTVGYFRITRDGTPVYFSALPLSAYRQETTDFHQLYRISLFTDREIYQPGDDIQFWGVLAPRQDNVPTVDRAWLTLGVSYPRSEITRIAVDVAADGTFSGVLPVSFLQGGYYSLSLLPYEDAPGVQEEERTYIEKSLSIQQYEKPPYTITMSTDKTVYHINDQITFTVTGAYYDGTPLAGGEFRLTCEAANLVDTQMVLDESGVGTVTGRLDPNWFQPGYGQVMAWEPTTVSWSVFSADEVNANVSQWESFMAMPSLYALSLTQDAQSGQLTVRTAMLDESKIGDTNTPRPWSYWLQDEFERLAGASVDLPVSLIVHRVTYIQRQTGTRYDPVNKENHPVYTYDREETVVETQSLRTVGGTAATTFTETPEENVHYWYELRTNGGIFGQVSTSTHRSFPYPSDTGSSYTFFSDTLLGERVVKKGENLALAVHENGTAVSAAGYVLPQNEAAQDATSSNAAEISAASSSSASTDNRQDDTSASVSVPESNYRHAAGLRALYTLVQNDHVGFSVLDGVQGSVTMTDELAPNAWLTGAFFDGQRVHIMEKANLVFDYTDETLNIAVNPDKETYKPGEDVKVAITVTDQQGQGEPSSGVIAVVDEAVFDLRQQSVDLAAELYGQIYSGAIQSGVSHGGSDNGSLLRASSSYGITTFADTAAEAAVPQNTGGGGGEQQVRSVFADTAAFIPFTTDENGSTELTFSMPDNLTSWRLTALAVTPEQKAGSVLTNRVTTLPFYLNPIVSDRYASGDSLALTLRCVAGETVLSATDTAAYEVTLQDASGKAIETKTVSGGILESVSVDFGPREVGQYSLLISGSAGESTDAVLLPVQVSDAVFYAPARRIMSLTQLKSLESEAYPVTLTFFNAKQSSAYEALSLLTSQGSQRTELLASDYGASVHLESFAETPRTIWPPSLLEEMQKTPEGGVRALPSGESEPALTAKIQLILPELLRKDKTIAYFHTVLEDPSVTGVDRAMACLGLAASGEAILADLQRMLEDEGYSTVERLYLAAACAVLGDYKSGAELVDALTKERQIRQESGMLYIEGNGTQEERLQLTEALLYLTTAARLPQSDGAAAFFLAQDRDRARLADIFFEPALLYYAQNTYAPEENLSVSYKTVSGEDVRLPLGKSGAVTQAFDFTGLQEANFTAHGGDIYASVSYYAPVELPEASQSIQVRKQYFPLSGTNHLMGGRTRVEITVTLPEGAEPGRYTLTDAIPAGMRFLSATHYRTYAEKTVYAEEQDSMRVEAAFYYAPPEDESEREIEPASLPPDVHLPAQASEKEPAHIAPSAQTSAEYDRTYKIVYYTSNPIAGTFATQPAAVTTPQGQQAVSDAGTVVIQGKDP